MAFKLKYKDLNNTQFMGALGKVGAMPLPVKTSYNIAKIIRITGNHRRDAKPEYVKLLKKHCKLTEAGEFVPETRKNEKGETVTLPGSYIVREESKEAFEKDVKAFLDIDIEIECHKINLNDFEDVKVDAHTLSLLEPVLVSIGAV